MSNALIYVAIAVAVVAMVGAISYGTENQKNYISEDVVLSQAVEQELYQKQDLWEPI